MILELIAHKSYYEKLWDITYWRTKTGLEVDFILGQAEVAIEVKISKNIEKKDVRGLVAFMEEYSPKKAIIATTES